MQPDTVELDDVNADRGRRILIKGGSVLTMSGDTPSTARGDVLIDGETITAVGPDLEVADGSAMVLEAAGKIVMPGFHDTHRHCWLGLLRRALVDADFSTYHDDMHEVLAPAYTAEDIRAASELSSWGALDSGVTSMLDFMHNPRDLDYAVAAMEGHAATGLRTVVAFCAPQGWGWRGEWPELLAEIRAEHLRMGNDLITMRSGVQGYPDPAIPARVTLDADKIRHARELGLPIVADAVAGDAASRLVCELHNQGELGPDVTFIHCNSLTAAAWDAIEDSGVRVVICPTSDTHIGIGNSLPPIQEVLNRNVVAGLSVDVECTLPTDMFAQMQATYLVQRMRVFRGEAAGDSGAASTSGHAPEPMTAGQVLRLATACGADVNGFGAISGTLDPGRQADLIVLDGNSVANMPLNDPVATALLGVGVRDVETVLVGGRIRKHAGDLIGCDVAALRRRVQQSRDDVFARSGFRESTTRGFAGLVG